MKKALIHESQPNLIKRIYHVVFRKTISDRHRTFEWQTKQAVWK